MVVDDHVRLPDALRPANGDQSRIARSGADNIDPSLFRHESLLTIIWYRELRIQRRSPHTLFLFPIDLIEEGATALRQDVIREFPSQGLEVRGGSLHLVADHHPPVDAPDQPLQK